MPLLGSSQHALKLGSLSPSHSRPPHDRPVAGALPARASEPPHTPPARQAHAHAGADPQRRDEQPMLAHPEDDGQVAAMPAAALVVVEEAIRVLVVRVAAQHPQALGGRAGGLRGDVLLPHDAEE